MRTRKIALAAAASIAAALAGAATVSGPLAGSGHAGVTWGSFAPPPPPQPEAGTSTTPYWQWR